MNRDYGDEDDIDGMAIVAGRRADTVLIAALEAQLARAVGEAAVLRRQLEFLKSHLEGNEELNYLSTRVVIAGTPIAAAAGAVLEAAMEAVDNYKEYLTTDAFTEERSRRGELLIKCSDKIISTIAAYRALISSTEIMAGKE